MLILYKKNKLEMKWMNKSREKENWEEELWKWKDILQYIILLSSFFFHPSSFFIYFQRKVKEV